MFKQRMSSKQTITIEKLLQEVKNNNPDADLALIKKAYNYAFNAHKNQRRKSGEHYIIHPLSTAYYLAKLKLDSTTIAAGLLHDILEDTLISKKELEKEFGKTISFLVEGVSKLDIIKYRGSEIEAENLRKLFLAMAQDIRVILIRLCDRLHNLKTLNFLPVEKQKRIALESLEIYAPLAHRLGIGRMKGAIEDLCFPYVYPEEYEKLMPQVKERYHLRKKYLKKVKPIIEKELKKERIVPIEIQFRAKHYYSLFQKLQRYGNDLNRIYDLIALRIIVKDIETCYRTLGVIHKLWSPLPGRIKDYIALPKPNGYRSLHTTVFCVNGKITEFQIRTPEMEEETKHGIAAHWYYSEKKGFKAYLKKLINKTPEKEMGWIKQLQKWQTATSPSEFIESLKIDFFKDRIFVFTPRGKVIDLPQGACLVDFAYAIHTDIGNQCDSAKVNGEIKPLSFILKNGDIAEITINKKRKPSRDWLAFVKTSLARNQIRKTLKITTSPEEIDKKRTASLPVLKKIEKEKPLPKGLVTLSGETGILTHLAKCCYPYPPDEIKAYITKNQGASIHKIDCPILKNMKKKWPQRVVEASWIKK